MAQEKLFDPEEVAPNRPEGGCKYHRHCGNLTPGETASGNRLCDSCLAAFRHRDQHGVPETYDVEAYLESHYE